MKTISRISISFCSFRRNSFDLIYNHVFNHDINKVIPIKSNEGILNLVNLINMNI